MASEESTNRNYLAILGNGEGTLYDASEAMGGLDPRGVTMAFGIIRGCCIMGPKDTDPERCVVLVAAYENPAAWSLIDYREAIPDSELERRKQTLLQKIDSQARKYVRVQSTQDHEFRERAVAFRERSLGK